MTFLTQAGVGSTGGLAGLSTGTGTVAAPGSTTPQEYYAMQYPSCYSPATQGYAQYTSMMGGSTPSSAGTPGAGGGAAGAPPGQDYTPPTSSSTQPQPPQGRRSPGDPGAGPPPGGAPASSQQQQQQQNLVAPLTQANVGAQNCKYADSNVGSPQDLSTASSGGTPAPGAGPGGLQPPKSPESDLEEPTSPLSPSPSGGKKEDVKSNPPQIYPWMKRVHLGQSKSYFNFLMLFPLPI